MDCAQALKLSETLFAKKDQLVIEESLRDVGVGYATAIIKVSLYEQLMAGLLTEERVRTAYTEAGLDPNLVDDLLNQKQAP